MIKNMIDIIVVTYNRIEYIKTFVDMLYKSTDYPFRLIVVDNGSTDGTREWLQLEPRVYGHTFTAENIPLAAALTLGYEIHVESKYFITVADDMCPPMFKNPDWLELFVAKMEQDESIGCINFVGQRQDFAEFNRKVRPNL